MPVRLKAIVRPSLSPSSRAPPERSELRRLWSAPATPAPEARAGEWQQCSHTSKSFIVHPISLCRNVTCPSGLNSIIQLVHTHLVDQSLVDLSSSCIVPPQPMCARHRQHYPDCTLRCLRLETNCPVGDSCRVSAPRSQSPPLAPSHSPCLVTCSVV